MKTVDLSRIGIVYAEDGGAEKDGLIFIKGKKTDDGRILSKYPELTFGNAQYSYVWIPIAGGFYAKGMARYSEDVPDCVDIVIYTNHKKADGYRKVLKKLPIEVDANPVQYISLETGRTKNSLVWSVAKTTKETRGKRSALKPYYDLLGKDGEKVKESAKVVADRIEKWSIIFDDDKEETPCQSKKKSKRSISKRQ